MKYRKKLHRKKDRKYFSKTADRTHRRNSGRQGIKRGGTRL